MLSTKEHQSENILTWYNNVFTYSSHHSFKTFLRNYMYVLRKKKQC